MANDRVTELTSEILALGKIVDDGQPLLRGRAVDHLDKYSTDANAIAAPVIKKRKRAKKAKAKE